MRRNTASSDRVLLVHEYPEDGVARAWQECLERCPRPGHYETPAFFREPFWTGKRPFAVLARDGGRVTGILTGIHQGRRVESGNPFRPQVCVDPTADPEQTVNALAEGVLRESRSADLATVFSWRQMPLPGFTAEGFRRRPAEACVVLDLSQGAEAVFAQFDSNRRRNVRSALKRGLEVIHATTIEDFKAFYEVYVAWRQTTRKEILGELMPFEMSERALRLADNRRLLLAREGGRVIAGITLRFHRGGLLEFAGSSALEERLALRPHDLLQWRAIEWGCEQGFQRYSLGGADDFHRKFGGTVVETDRYRIDHTLMRRYDLQEAVRKAARRTVQRAPAWLRSALGRNPTNL